MNTYIEELNHSLKSLNQSDRKEIVDYYNEYLEDGKFTNYSECVNELGTPQVLSKQVLADYSIQNSNEEKNHGYISNLKTTWLIMLAILASPVALIISLPVLGSILVTIIVTVVIIFSLIIAILTMTFTLIVTFPTAVSRLFTAFSAGISLLGADLLIVGTILIAIPLIIFLLHILTKTTKKISSYLYQRFIKQVYQLKGGIKQ